MAEGWRTRVRFPPSPPDNIRSPLRWPFLFGGDGKDENPSNRFDQIVQNNLGRDAHDNAGAEGLCQLLRRARIKKKIFRPGNGTRGDVFNDIEMFYNITPQHKHGSYKLRSSVEYENRYQGRLCSV